VPTLGALTDAFFSAKTISAGPKTNPERAFFVDRPTIAKVLAACPNAQWRLLVGLRRFAGLRCPSEILPLTWADVL
jgi:integrase